MFSRKCVCKLNISKIIWPLLAALSVNGLIKGDRMVIIFHLGQLRGFLDVRKYVK